MTLADHFTHVEDVLVNSLLRRGLKTRNCRREDTQVSGVNNMRWLILFVIVGCVKVSTTANARSRAICLVQRVSTTVD